MSITWGPWLNSASGNGVRVGYEVDTQYFSDTTGVDVTGYVQTRYPVTDSQNSVTVTGVPSGSRSIAIRHSAGEITTIGEWSGGAPRTYGAGRDVKFSISITGLEAIPGTATVSGSWWSPARAYLEPRPPLAASVRRVSDREQVITWSANYDGASDARPWSGVYILRWDSATGKYARIADASWSQTSYTDRTTVPGRRYRYWLISHNSAGESGWATSAITGYVATSPTAATGVTAAKSATDVDVTWKNTASYLTQIKIWHYANGVKESAPIATLPGTAMSWTHTNASTAVTHSYTVQGVADGLAGAESARTATIALLARPNAPRLVSPVSTPVDASEAIWLTWQHSPTDGTSQLAARVQWRKAGETEWRTVSVGTAQRVAVTSGVTNGDTIEWQAQARGQHADWSPWSPVATFTTSARPIATILEPKTTVKGARVTARWAYHDPEGTAQTAWRATLKSSAGVQLASYTGSGAVSERVFYVHLADKARYSVTVEVQDGAGLWSSPTTHAFSVAYAEPPVTEIHATWSEIEGEVTLALKTGTAAAGSPDPVSVDVQRLTDGHWLTIAAKLDPGTTIVDPIAPLGADVQYRTVTQSALPSQAISKPVTIYTKCERGWTWLNAGPSFAVKARVRANPQYSARQQRQIGLLRFDGREFPTEYRSTIRSYSGSMRANLSRESSTAAEVRAVADMPAPICMRIACKRRLFVAIASAEDSLDANSQSISWEWTEIGRNLEEISDATR